ncbi:MAG: GDP-mannose mannosyl hydrolase [Gammaproteobacteria bacterium]|nr:GDP-mannose mannosyl hydrolase [Gammaproteobacteria bacterium]
MLDNQIFLEIIKSTPLISIDLIIQNSEGKILLGKRLNRPAQGYWFVPGGRIIKNETLADAIKRISSNELGATILINDAQLIGAFDHIYTDNCFGDEGINTHYVVLAYKTYAQNDVKMSHDNQHSEIKWWSKYDLLNASDVHQNTKIYFTSN